MNRKTIVVTGAAGFIGSHASTALIGEGYRVVGIDNFNDFYDRRWKELNAAAVSKDSTNFALEEIDITDAAPLARVIETVKPVAILHLAAMAGVRPSIDRPAYYSHVNVTGTTNLLQSAVQNGVERFLLASSSSVYGNNPVPFSEEQPVDHPISPYAATKRACELIGHTFWHLHQLPVFCLRFFTVFGPRQRPDLAIHKFTRLIDEGKPIPFYGDGSTSRDYTYVADICAGITAALRHCDRFRIYNLGGSHPISLKDLVGEIELAVGKKAVLDKRPAQPGDVERTYADITRANSELGYKPRMSIPEGLKQFVAWYREQGHLYRPK